MEKEFKSLSEKMQEIIDKKKKLHDFGTGSIIEYLINYEIANSIKEFIKRENELIEWFMDGVISFPELMEKRRKLAGDKLIERENESNESSALSKDAYKVLDEIERPKLIDKPI